MSQKTLYKCDICSEESFNDHDFIIGEKRQMIFTTEQTEGHNVSHYLTFQPLDTCKPCLSRIVKGEPLFGSGAMGYNTYWFNKPQII